MDIRADIGAADTGAWFIVDIRGFTDNSTTASVIFVLKKCLLTSLFECKLPVSLYRPAEGFTRLGQN